MIVMHFFAVRCWKFF